MFDPLQNSLDALSSVARIAEVTPSDANDVAFPATAIYLDAAGTLRITDLAGNVVNFSNLAAGYWHPMRVSRVHSTGTTATGIKIGYPK